MSNDKAPAPLRITALPVIDVARFLSVAGGCDIGVKVIEEHLLDGAPVNEDGTVNLITYAAWLVKRRSAIDAGGETRRFGRPGYGPTGIGS